MLNTNGEATITGFQNPLPGVPNIESPFFEQIFAHETSEEFMRIARSLHEEGYAIIDFPEPELDVLSKRIINELSEHYDWSDRNNGAKIGPRVQDAWKFNEHVRRIATNSAILDLLAKLYGRQALPFQTLNFPVGTQQHFHSDSVHFSSQPERYMCGVWVAFEDVDETNGPLEYYPKSHKLPIYLNEALRLTPHWETDQPIHDIYKCFGQMWRQLVEVHQLERKEFYPRKGQAIIWAANLLHGGADQADHTRTRHSQVTHYFFEDCAYYAPILSIPFRGAIFYRDVYDIARDRPVPHQVNGKLVPATFTEACAAHLNLYAMQNQPTLPVAPAASSPPPTAPTLKQKLKAKMRQTKIGQKIIYLKSSLSSR